MRDVYFWNDLLPANVDLSQYSTPEELLIDLTSVQPLDQFSFITSAQAVTSATLACGSPACRVTAIVKLRRPPAHSA